MDYLCLLTKNLYNVALYNIRQQYFKDKTYLNYNALDKLLYSNVDYKAIPYRQSAQQILRSVDKTYSSFFKGIKSDKNKGKRIKRGLFISSKGIKINADINGSLNIMVVGLKQLNVKRDVLILEPANLRFVLNPVRVCI